MELAEVKAKLLVLEKVGSWVSSQHHGQYPSTLVLGEGRLCELMGLPFCMLFPGVSMCG